MNVVDMEHDLRRFTSELDKIVTDECDRYEYIVRRTEPPLKHLMTDMRWLPPRFCEPRVNSSVQYVIHRSATLNYTITSVVFWPGYTTKVHDHGTWGVIGVWRGEEREERFRDVNGGIRPGYANLSLQQTVVNKEGCVSLLIPPHQEIHRIHTTSTNPSFSIHIYGNDLDGKPRHEFDLETGEIREFKVQFVR